MGAPAGRRLRPDARPLPGRAGRLPAGRRGLGDLRRLEPAAAGGLARPRDVLADPDHRGRRRRRRRAARRGPGEPVRPPVARGARHPRVGRPGRGRRGDRADRAPGRDRAARPAAGTRARRPSGWRSGTPRAGWSTAASGRGREPPAAARRRARARRTRSARPLGAGHARSCSARVAPGCGAGRSSMSSTSTCPTSRSRCPRPTAGTLSPLGPDAVQRTAGGLGLGGARSTARIEDRTVVFEYECTYLGGRAFNAKEVGLTLRPSSDLVDLWWRRIGDWTLYPPAHVGRTAGYAPGAAGTDHDAQPGADLGAGRDAGGQQRLPQREAAHPRRRRHRRQRFADGPVRRHAARPRGARRRRPGRSGRFDVLRLVRARRHQPSRAGTAAIWGASGCRGRCAVPDELATRSGDRPRPVKKP